MANANINIKSTGLIDLKRDLKDIKSQMVDLYNQPVLDVVKLEKLSKEAGKLSDTIADANEKVKVFAAGSEFEKIGNGLGLVGSQLRNLDFEGAAESAKLLTSTIKNANPAEIAKGFKGLASTVGELGKAFFQMGLKLLANPLFLIVAVVAAVVLAIVLLKDKVKILGDVFYAVSAAVKVFIQGLKDLTDALGLTSFAEEKAAEEAEKAAERKIAASEELIKVLSASYDRQIELAKANGENTFEIEQLKTKAIEKEAEKRKGIYEKNQLAILKNNKVANAQDVADLLYTFQTKEELAKYFQKQELIRDEDKAKKAAEDIFAQRINSAKESEIILDSNAKMEADRLNERKRRIASENTTENLSTNARINAMKEGLPKELAKIKETLKEKRDAIIADVSITEKERQERLEAAQLESNVANKKAIKKNAELRQDIQRQVIDGEIGLMQEGLDKELAVLESSYVKKGLAIDRDETKNKDEKLKLMDIAFKEYQAATQKAILADERQQREASQKKIDDLKKINDDLKAALKKQFDDRINDSGTEFQKEIAANHDHYEQLRADAIDVKEKQKALFDEQFKQGVLSLKEYNDKLRDVQTQADLDEQAATTTEGEKINEIRKKFSVQRIIDEANKVDERVKQVYSYVSMIGQILDSADETRINKIQSQANAESALLDQQRARELSNVNLTATQKDNIERKYALKKYQQDLANYQKLNEIKKKQFARDKAFRLAGAVIDTASATIAAFTDGAKTNLYLGIAYAAIAAAAGIAQISQISSQKYEGESGPSAPSINTPSGGSSEPVTPKVDLRGQNQLNNVGANGFQDDAGRPILVQAFVSETELTTTQRRVSRIEQSSQL